MKYLILSSRYEGGLEKQVNKAFKNGWNLQGGVSVTYCSRLAGDQIVFAQAMIKDVD